MVALYPLLDRGRYTDEEWELASAEMCNWVSQFGFRGRWVHCGQPSDPESFYRWCAEHDMQARDDNPEAYGR